MPSSPSDVAGLFDRAARGNDEGRSGRFWSDDKPESSRPRIAVRIVPPSPRMPSSPLVLHEDNHLLALFKPARLPTVGDASGDESLLDVARDYLRTKYAKPGNVFVGVVHRLDRPVSGVVLFAKTSKAAARLSQQFREGTVQKTYLALVEGRTPPGETVLEDWLRKDEQRNVVSRVAPDTPGAQRAVLAFRTLRATAERSWVEVRPQTGRSHQIRVQLAGAGHPIEGDAKYGARDRREGTIALHAAALRIEHPVRHDPLEIAAPAPEWEKS